jgi:transcriptional regulator
VIYIPRHFREDDTARLHHLIRTNSFGTLLSTQQDQIQVSHLPFLLDADRNVLRAHVARANPHWQTLTPDREVVAVFQGPHHYVSPDWYANHPSVPTWNYAVVHVHGRPKIIEDRAALTALMRDLVDEHESGMANPWQMALPVDYLEKMLDAIVGFEIGITRMDGKFKLSQNRPPADRPLVITALESLGNDNARGVAGLMRDIASGADPDTTGTAV